MTAKNIIVLKYLKNEKSFFLKFSWFLLISIIILHLVVLLSPLKYHMIISPDLFDLPFYSLKSITPLLKKKRFPKTVLSNKKIKGVYVI